MKKNKIYIVTETLFNEGMMSLKSAVYVLGVLLSAQMIIISIMCLITMSGEQRGVARQYALASAAQLLKTNPSFDVSIGGKIFEGVSAESLTHSHKIAGVVSGAKIKFGLAFLLSCGVYFSLPYTYRILRQRADKLEEKTFIRGAQLVEAPQLNSMIESIGWQQRFHIGTLVLPVEAEIRHGSIFGTPGVGKTQLIYRMITDALAIQGSKLVILDKKGDMVSKFYQPGRDFIFNPLDERTVGWSVFNEIKTVLNIQTIAASLIPESSNSNQDPFWNNAARDVFTGILHRLYAENKKTNGDIWRAITSKAAEITGMLEEIRGGEAGYTYIQDASGKQALSVLAVMMQFTRGFEFLKDADGDFSLEEWLRRPEGGIIFLTSYEEVKDTIKPLLSLFVDLLGKKIIDLPDDHSRRVMFILDEFHSLQRLPTIVDLLALGRSKGCGVWLSTQEIGQIKHVYGEDLMRTIIGSCSTRIVLKCTDITTAKYWSDTIGEQHYREYEITLSMGAADSRDGTSIQHRKEKEPLILPSEITNMPDRLGYVLIPRSVAKSIDEIPDGGYPCARIKIPILELPDRYPSFLRDDCYDLDKIFSVQYESAILATLVKKMTADSQVATEGSGGREMESASDEITITQEEIEQTGRDLAAESVDRDNDSFQRNEIEWM
jgi:hypothetical protein